MVNFSIAIQNDSSQATAYYYRGRTLVALKEWSLSISEFDKAIYLDSNNIDYISSMARAFLGLKNWEAASRCYIKILDLNLNAFEAYRQLGFIKLQIKALDQAESLLNRAIQINDKDAMSYFYRALLYSEQRRYKLAISDFEQAKQLDMFIVNWSFHYQKCKQLLPKND